MQSAERVIAAISRWMARVGGFLLLGAAILIAVEVVGRYTQWLLVSLGTELSAYILAVGATWSLAYVVFERAHVRVDVIAQRVPPGAKAVFDLLALLSLVVVGAVLTMGAGEMLATSLRLGSKSNTTLGMPLAIPHGAWSFGLLWFTFVSAFRLVQATLVAVKRDFLATSRIAGSPSVDDEVEEAIAGSQHHLGAEEGSA